MASNLMMTNFISEYNGTGLLREVAGTKTYLVKITEHD